MDYLTSEWPGTPIFKVDANFDMFLAHLLCTNFWYFFSSLQLYYSISKKLKGKSFDDKRCCDRLTHNTFPSVH